MLHQKSCNENPRNKDQLVTSISDVLHDDQNTMVIDTVFMNKDILTGKPLLKE